MRLRGGPLLLATGDLGDLLGQVLLLLLEPLAAAPPGAPERAAHRLRDLRHTYANVLLMFGANLTSVQKLLGHSDPKITERRYGHLLPDFMKSEVDRLQFGLDRLAPTLPASGAREAASGSDSQELAAVSGRLGTPVIRNG